MDANGSTTAGAFVMPTTSRIESIGCAPVFDTTGRMGPPCSETRTVTSSASLADSGYPRVPFLRTVRLRMASRFDAALVSTLLSDSLPTVFGPKILPGSCRNRITPALSVAVTSVVDMLLTTTTPAAPARSHVVRVVGVSCVTSVISALVPSKTLKNVYGTPSSTSSDGDATDRYIAREIERIGKQP